MRVAISVAGADLDAGIDPRFGRCQQFLIVDTETMAFEAIPNACANAMGGAGIQAAQTVASQKVTAVITGNVGPNAYQTLRAAGIEIFTGLTGTARSAVESLIKGELEDTGSATVSSHFGMGGGRGRGMGGRGR